MAIVQTVDFFPPIVDDPFTYGEIAAANAVSDVYAMGGTPLLALNIVGFPKDYPKEVLAEILSGGASKAHEAGMVIGGGHTIDDQEPKYGMSVTGLVQPGSQVTNSGAKPGNALVLTKPIGTGIITTAFKHGKVQQSVLDHAIESMLKLNHAASEAMTKVGVEACVDITGFGLAGHLVGMLSASGVRGRINVSKVPILKGTSELTSKGIAPGGTLRNVASLEGVVKWPANIDPSTKLIVCDAQTSGGLLISVDSGNISQLMESLYRAGVKESVIIGEILDDTTAIPRLEITT